MNRGVSARSLVLVIIVSVATTIGWRLLADRERAVVAAEPARSAESTAQLSKQIAELEQGLRELRHAVDRSASLGAGAAAAAGARAPSPLTESADARLEALAAQLATLGAQVVALGENLSADQERQRQELAAELKTAIADALVAGGARSEPMPDVLPESPPDLARLESMRGLKVSETCDLHLLWSYEQVGQQFGRPTRVSPSANGIGIKYIYEMPDGTEFCFWFVGGKVVKAFWV